MTDSTPDLLDIPAFLVRVPGDTKPGQRRRKAWRQTPLARKAAVRDAKKRAKVAARPLVHRAVNGGAETFQAIREATGLEPNVIHSALRFYVNQSRTIRKDGRRYFLVSMPGTPLIPGQGGFAQKVQDTAAARDRN